MGFVESSSQFEQDEKGMKADASNHQIRYNLEASAVRVLSLTQKKTGFASWLTLEPRTRMP